MQIEIKELEQCKLSVHYEADALEVLNKKSEVVNAFKKAPVPGFRPGKASPAAINIHYRQQIEDSLKRALAEDAFHNTIFEKKLRVHGAPIFHTINYNGGAFSCDFDVHTKPDFELSSYQGLEIPKPADPINATDLAEKMLQDLRMRVGEISPYSENDFIQEGDDVVLDYTATVDGEKLDNLSAEGEILKVGSSPMLDFDSNLYGMKMGETREFDLKVPEDGLPSLAGKTVHFSVTLQMGSKLTPAALDDAMAQKFGKSSFEELKQFVGATASARVFNTSKALVNEAICLKLIDNNKIDVPNWMALSEAQYLAFNSKLEWDKMSDVDKEKLVEMARKNVALALILDKIRELEPEAQLSDHEVFEIIKQHLAQTQTVQSVDDVIKEMNRTGQMQILFSRIRDEYTLDFIVKHARIVE